MAKHHKKPYYIEEEKDEALLMGDLITGTIESVDSKEETVVVNLSEPYTIRTSWTDYGDLQKGGYKWVEGQTVTRIEDVPIVYNCNDPDISPAAAFTPGDEVLIRAVNGKFYCVGFPGILKRCDIYVTLKCVLQQANLVEDEHSLYECQNFYPYYIIWDCINNTQVKLKDHSGTEIDPPYTSWQLSEYGESRYHTKWSVFAELQKKSWSFDCIYNQGDDLWPEICEWITEHPCIQSQSTPAVGCFGCGGFASVLSGMSPYILYDDGDPSVHGEVVCAAYTPQHYNQSYPEYMYLYCPLLEEDVVFPNVEQYNNNEADYYPKLIIPADPPIVFTNSMLFQAYVFTVTHRHRDGTYPFELYVYASCAPKEQLFNEDGTWKSSPFSYQRTQALEDAIRDALLASKAKADQLADDLGCWPPGCRGVNYKPTVEVVRYN